MWSFFVLTQEVWLFWAVGTPPAIYQATHYIPHSIQQKYKLFWLFLRCVKALLVRRFHYLLFYFQYLANVVFQSFGTNARNFDGEIAAVLLAAKELNNYHPTTATKLYIIDSQTYITAIADNTPTDSPNLFHCREVIVLLLLNNWSVILQWIPSHVGIADN